MSRLIIRCRTSSVAINKLILVYFRRKSMQWQRQINVDLLLVFVYSHHYVWHWCHRRWGYSSSLTAPTRHWWFSNNACIILSQWCLDLTRTIHHTIYTRSVLIKWLFFQSRLVDFRSVLWCKLHIVFYGQQKKVHVNYSGNIYVSNILVVKLSSKIWLKHSSFCSFRMFAQVLLYGRWMTEDGRWILWFLQNTHHVL